MPSKNLTEKQIRAAILLGQGRLQVEVAKELGVNVKTLQRWSKDPEFQKVKNNVGASVTEATIQEAAQETVKATTEAIIKSTTTFSFTDRVGLIDEEYRLLQLVTEVCERKLIEDSDLRAGHLLIKLSERKCRLLGLDFPRSDLSDALMVLASLRGSVDEKALNTIIDASRQLLLNQ
ncbi:hypothetical protein CAL7716_107720 (plasmid) [Calothrix sp. PCC 7716]|nr:hypothetical protein CAL7716_107720 [Calothrix sp. PCC 7716]